MTRPQKTAVVPPLLAQELAVHCYLQELLAEPPPVGPVTVEPAPAPPGPAPASVSVGPGPGADAPHAPHAPRVPEWAREPFQCLLFQVAGLKLAVPLARLNGVLPFAPVTPLPNHSEHFLGLLPHQGRNVRIVDLARVVLAERQLQGGLRPAAERCRNIVLVAGGAWGLACDGIGDALTLDAGRVRWRSAAGRRPWLAGTVLEHLCALLDTEALVEMLGAGREAMAGDRRSRVPAKDPAGGADMLAEPSRAGPGNVRWGRGSEQ